MPEAHGKVPFDSSERPSQESLDRVRERAESDLEGGVEGANFEFSHTMSKAEWTVEKID